MDKEIEKIIQEIIHNKPDLERKCPREIKRALVLIHSNLFEYHLTIDWIKKEGHIFNKCFSTLFKRYVGSYPKEYIIANRISAAKELMIKTDHAISVIAIHVGFRSTSAFCNTFKNKEKFKPSEWRKINKYIFKYKIKE
ncbi:MAG: AraC family transcriptional regulator [Candidatus Paceibacterota bacterium]